MKKILLLCCLLAMVSLSGCSCAHAHATEATCENSGQCIDCGQIIASPLGHDWLEDDCAELVCSQCGKTEKTGKVHKWGEKIENGMKTCEVCGKETISLDCARVSMSEEKIINVLGTPTKTNDFSDGSIEDIWYISAKIHLTCWFYENKLYYIHYYISNVSKETYEELAEKHKNYHFNYDDDTNELYISFKSDTYAPPKHENKSPKHENKSDGIVGDNNGNGKIDEDDWAEEWNNYLKDKLKNY